MKRTLTFLTAACYLSLAPLPADEKDHKHDHDHHHHDDLEGPNKGKILHEVDPHAELFVTKDRKLQITFLDHKGKAVAPKEQTISVICGKRTAPPRMSFAKKGSSFVSDKALPEGKNIPTVLQIKMKPDTKTTMNRFNLNLEDCPSCDVLEYACKCDHGDDHDHKHEKK